MNAITYVFATLAGHPLRHPKSSATPTFSAACKAVPYPKPIYGTRSNSSWR
jgi:hypothetical protein